MKHINIPILFAVAVFGSPVSSAATITVEHVLYHIKSGDTKKTMHDRNIPNNFSVGGTIMRLNPAGAQCRAFISGAVVGWNAGNDWSHHSQKDARFDWTDKTTDSELINWGSPGYTSGWIHLGLSINNSNGYVECVGALPAGAYISTEALIVPEKGTSFYMGHHVPLTSLTTPEITKKSASVPDNFELTPGRHPFVEGDIQHVKLYQDGKETTTIVLTSADKVTTKASYNNVSGEITWTPDPTLQAGAYKATVTACISLE